MTIKFTHIFFNSGGCLVPVCLLAAAGFVWSLEALAPQHAASATRPAETTVCHQCIKFSIFRHCAQVYLPFTSAHTKMSADAHTLPKRPETPFVSRTLKCSPFINPFARTILALT